MSIRLNKAISELNIGLQTAVDFLEKKAELGEVKNDLNFKLNDAQYDALVVAFKGDKEFRTQAEKIFQKKEKTAKKEKPQPTAVEPQQAKTAGDALIAKKAEVKPLGKIDLGTGKPAAEAPAKAEPKAVTETPKAEEKHVYLMNQYDVFISYSRKDSYKVFPIVKKLEDKGLSVWIDRDGVESGDAFKSVIVGGIKKSNIFLFFSSANANESSWTVKEVDTAVYLKKKIIPVKLDEADYADSILFDLAGLDFADLSIEEKKEAELNKLIASLLSKKPTQLRERDNAITLSAEELFKKGSDFYIKRLYIEAFPYFKKSAEQGLAEAQFNLGFMYDEGQGVDQDKKQAVYWYRKSAEQGDAEAQCNLGYMYEKGQRVDLDYKQAVYWYRKSAEQGDARAQCNLGDMYLFCKGVNQDKKQAAYWYRKSAEQGYAEAQFNLGFMYDEDLDYKQAVYWYRKSAEQGDARAQCNLGDMYLFCKGVKPDYKQAAYWYRKSAEQGYAEAQFNLGVEFSIGRGVDQDKKQAAYWYRKSAEQGDAEAQCILGVMYDEGQGVDQDKKQAAYWYRKSAEQGWADAKKRLKELENKL